MRNASNSFFELVILEKIRPFYIFRLTGLFLGAVFAYTLYESASREQLGLVFLLWLLSAVFFFFGLLRVDQKEAVFFAQSLSDILFILSVIHLTGGTKSVFWAVFLLWGTLLSGVQAEKFDRIYAVLLGLLPFGLLEAYRHGWLTAPAMPAHYLPASLAWQNEAILLAALFSGIFLFNKWSRGFKSAWIQNEDRREFLRIVAEIASLDLSLSAESKQYRPLAEKVLNGLGCQTVFITRWDETRRQVYLLGGSGQESVTQPISPLDLTLKLLQTGEAKISWPDPRGRFWVALSLRTPDGGVFLGSLILVYAQAHDQALEETFSRARQIGDIVALLLDKSYRYQELNRRATMLERLSQEIVHLTSDLQQEKLLPSIARATRELLGAHKVAIFTKDEDDEASLTCKFAEGISNAYADWFARNYRALWSTEGLDDDDYVAVADIMRDERTSPQIYYLHQEAIAAYALFQLKAKGEVIGVLGLYWTTPHVFNEQELIIGRLFARQAAESIANADAYGQVVQTSMTDALTGLPNRRALDQRLIDEEYRAQRYQREFAFMMLDLDGFKQVNDQYGHPIGDSVLQQVALELRHIVRSSDFLARYGGDEFSVLLPETGLEEALVVAKKIRAALERYALVLPNDERRPMLSTAVGIAVYPHDAQDLNTLLEVADRRLYQAKKKGRGEICFDY